MSGSNIGIIQGQFTLNTDPWVQHQWNILSYLIRQLVSCLPFSNALGVQELAQFWKKEQHMVYSETNSFHMRMKKYSLSKNITYSFALFFPPTQDQLVCLPLTRLPSSICAWIIIILMTWKHHLVFKARTELVWPLPAVCYLNINSHSCPGALDQMNSNGKERNIFKNPEVVLLVCCHKNKMSHDTLKTITFVVVHAFTDKSPFHQMLEIYP